MEGSLSSSESHDGPEDTNSSVTDGEPDTWAQYVSDHVLKIISSLQTEIAQSKSISFLVRCKKNTELQEDVEFEHDLHRKALSSHIFTSKQRKVTADKMDSVPEVNMNLWGFPENKEQRYNCRGWCPKQENRLH